MNDLIEILSNFKQNRFDKRASCHDPKLKPLAEKLNEVADYFQGKAQIEKSAEERAAESAKQLAASESKYRSLIEHSPFCIHEIDLNGILTSMNPAGLRMLGLNNECQIQGLHYVGAVADEDKNRINALLDKAYLGESSFFEFKSAGQKPNYFRSCFVPMRSSEGVIEKLMGITEDITAAKGIQDKVVQTANALALEKNKLIESNRQLKEAQLVAKIGNWSFDIGTGQVIWSEQMFEMFPESKENGPPAYDRHVATIHPEDQSHWKKTVDKCLTDGLPYKMRFRSVYPDKCLWIEAYGKAAFDSRGKITGLFGTCQDVSEQVRVNEALERERSKSVQTMKLATLGEMAAGIAHEINNPLAIVEGSVRLIPKFLDNSEKLNSKLLAINKSVQRISTIVGGLKKFSRTAEMVPYRHHVLAQIISEAVLLVEPKSKRLGVQIRAECKSNSIINCNEVEIEQVLINLIGNSIDAVGEKPDKWVNIELFDEGGFVILRVLDSGRGISKEILPRLFEPFFTTKRVGDGTGLGLSISKGILDDHGADIRVVPESPNTCFEVRFKKVEEINNLSIS